MKNFLLTICALFFVATTSFRADAAQALWVSVTPSATVQTEEGPVTFLDFLSASGVNAARVITDAARVLLVYFSDGYGGYVVENGVNTFDVAAGGSGEQILSIDGIAADTTLTIELGHVDWDAYDQAFALDPNAEPEFEVLARSDSQTLQQLDGNGHVAHGGYDTPDFDPWTPTSYSAYTPVPEAAAPALLFMGLAALLARRRPGAA